MSAIIIRFQFSEFRATEFVDLLKQRYGGGVNYIAEGTILIDTLDSADEVYEVLAPLFTYDDKLFVGEVHNFKSLHNISRTKPAMHKVAI
jgi:hypothetical protein